MSRNYIISVPKFKPKFEEKFIIVNLPPFYYSPSTTPLPLNYIDTIPEEFFIFLY